MEVKTTPKYVIPEGLTKSQKKNFRKSQRAKQKKAASNENESVLDIPLPEDNMYEERKRLVETIQAQLKSMINLANVPSANLEDVFRKQQNELETYRHEIVEAMNGLKKIQKIDTRQFSTEQILNELQTHWKAELRDEEAIAYFIEQYGRLMAWENALKIRPQLQNILEQVQLRKEKNIAYHTEFREKKGSRKRGDDKEGPHHKGLAMDSGDNKRSEMEKEVIILSEKAASFVSSRQNMIRKIKHLFNVVLDGPMNKDSSSSKQYTLYGSSADIEYLSLLFKECDFTNPPSINIDSSKVPGFVGKGGASVQKMEEELKCIINANLTGQITLYGRKADTDAAIAKIQADMSRRSVSSDQFELEVENEFILRALSQRQFSKHAIPDDMREKVIIRPGSTAFKISVSTRSIDSAQVENLKNHLTSYLKKLTLVSFSSEKAFFEYYEQYSLRKSRQYRQTDGDEARLSSNTYYSRLHILLTAHSQIALIPDSKHSLVHIVGTKEDLDLYSKQIQQNIIFGSCTPSKFEVPSELNFLMNVTKLATIELSYSVSIKRLSRRSDNPSTEGVVIFDILGLSSDQQKAVKELSEYVQNEGHILSYEFQAPETVQALLKNSSKLLKSLRDQYEVNINVLKQSSTCNIIGPKKAVQDTLDHIKKIDEEQKELAASTQTLTIQLPSSDCIQAIIGTRGSTIQNLEFQTNVQSIHINRQNLLVEIRGTPEACDLAQQKIKNIIETAQSKISQKQTKELDSSKKQTDVSESSEHIILHMSEETFPAIDEAIHLNDSKLKPRRRKCSSRN